MLESPPIDPNKERHSFHSGLEVSDILLNTEEWEVLNSYSFLLA